MSSQSSKQVGFGEFELDLERRELRRAGALCELQARTFDLLAYLARHAGEVLSRERLLSDVWGDVNVSDGALSTAIYEVRRVLGDAERPEPWLRTLRGRGFRFDAEVRALAAAPASRSRDGAPYFGRAGLLERLVGALDTARTGRGQLVLLAGEAGMGKTRTALELIDRAEPLQVARGWCDERHAAPAFWPWTQILRDLPGTTLSEASAEALGLREGSAPLGEVPWDEPLLGSRVDVLDGLAAGLRRASGERPLLIVLEDLHDADQPSIDALEFVARRLADWPVLLLVTYRPDQLVDPGGALGGVVSLPHAHQLELEPLDVRQVLGLVQHVLGRAPAQWIAHEIHERSGGNPFFAHALAREVDPVAGPPADMPRGIHAVLSRRLSRLRPATRRALSVAASVGAEFDVEFVEAVEGGALASDWLEEARSAGLIEPRPSPGALRFGFRHALLRDASEADLELLERARLHQQLAEFRLARDATPTGRDLTEIAHHLAAALPVAKNGREAFRFAMAAADQALRSAAWESCDDHTAVAHSILREATPDAFELPERLRVLALRCVALNARGGRETEMAELLEEAAPLLGHAGATELRPIFAGLRFVHEGNLGRYGAAMEGVEALREAGGGPPGVEGLWSATLEALTGDFTAAQDGVPDDARPGAGHRPFALRVAQEPTVVGLAITSLACFALGHEQRALERSARACLLAEELRDVYSGAMVHFVACMLHDLRGDADALADSASRIDPLCTEHHIARFLGAGFMFGSWADELRGSPTIPIANLAAVVAPRFDRPEGGGFRAYVQTLVARMFEQAGDPDEAGRQAAAAREWSESQGERWMASETWRVTGRLAHARARSGEARDAWQAARDVARQQRSPVFELRALLDLHEHLGDRAAGAEAVQLIQRTPELPGLDRTRARDVLGHA